MSYGACGFDNNGISVYSSRSLANTGWRLETANALPAATRAVGEYWEPNMQWNPKTERWVMWYIYSAPNTTLGAVQVITAAKPAGPWTLVNRNVTLRHPSFTSAELFVDPADGVAYVLYSSIGGDYVGPHHVYSVTPAVVMYMTCWLVPGSR